MIDCAKKKKGKERKKNRRKKGLMKGVVDDSARDRWNKVKCVEKCSYISANLYIETSLKGLIVAAIDIDWRHLR